MSDSPQIIPFIIGVAGGSGSGKTTVSSQLQTAVGAAQLAYLQHDNYYYDYSQLSLTERAHVNYDHPDSLETSLLIQHLQALRQGCSVEMPLYDFTHYRRKAETQPIQPARVIIVEGVLIFVEKALRELMDLRIFVDADADLRFIRRLQRDMEERERSLASVVEQYLTTVRPMHLEFVEPSKRYAHVIIPEGGQNQVAMALLVSRVQAILAQA
ncbi:MAG: uridine kinase [Caldilineaceae bacterium]